jgi:hypothetical protein
MQLELLLDFFTSRNDLALQQKAFRFAERGGSLGNRRSLVLLGTGRLRRKGGRENSRYPEGGAKPAATGVAAASRRAGNFRAKI